MATKKRAPSDETPPRTTTSRTSTRATKSAPKPTRAAAKPSAARAPAKKATPRAAAASTTASKRATTKAEPKATSAASRTTTRTSAAPRSSATTRTSATRAAAKPLLRASHGGYTRSAEEAPARKASSSTAARPAAKRAASSGTAARGASTARGRVAVKSGAARPAPVKKAKEGLTPPRKPRGKAAPVEETIEPSTEARELALAIASAGIDKKALGIEILDVTGKVDYADFLVVMTGRSDRHVHAIATGIEEALRRAKRAPISVEGLSVATWVLLDFGEVVVHVFQEDARSLYDIEGLWVDASRVPVDNSAELEA